MIRLGKDAYRYQKDFTPFFDRLKCDGINFIHSVILIGSLADETNLRFSDCDLILCYDKKPDLYQLEKINMLTRNFLRKYDFLQHHGFVLMKSIHSSWCESEIPSSTISKAKVIFRSNDNPILIKYNDNDFELNARRNLFVVSDSLAKRISEKNFPINYYQYKSILSQCLLLPALVSSVHIGYGVDKADSFGLIRSNELFTKNELLWIEIAEFARLNWEYEPNKVIQYCHSHLSPRIHKVFVKIPNLTLKDSIFSDLKFISSLTLFLKKINDYY